MATAKTTRNSIKKALMSRLDAAGNRDAVTEDLVEQYLTARDRLESLKLDYADALEEAAVEGTTKIATEISNMARILSMLSLTPQSKRREQIENEMREQLKAKGLKGPVFEDRIAQFMALWDAFQEANNSLLERGRSYITISSSGKTYEKDNTATRDIVTFAKAMQDALDSMEITVKGYTNPDDDEL